MNVASNQTAPNQTFPQIEVTIVTYEQVPETVKYFRSRGYKWEKLEQSFTGFCALTFRINQAAKLVLSPVTTRRAYPEGRNGLG